MDVGLNPTFFPTVLGVGLSTLDDKDEINRNECEKREKMQMKVMMKMKMNMKTTDHITTMLHHKIPFNPSQSFEIPRNPSQHPYVLTVTN